MPARREYLRPERPLSRAKTAGRNKTELGADPEQMTELVKVLVQYRNGDFSARLPHTWGGSAGYVANLVNDILMISARRASETRRLCRVVGKEGKLKQRFSLAGLSGGWADEVSALNKLIDDLVSPTTDATRAVGAVAKGDLSQSMALERDGRPLEGEFLRGAMLLNRMIEQLSVFASEVTRVAREVGTDGKLGGQAQVNGVSGVWKDLTESVNRMAGNLTAQVRNIAEVTIAVANGDLSKKITVDVRGEILQLKEAINTMVDQLRSFASEVTRVAREVGTDGKLGGQAKVTGAAGTWKDLTDNVNFMADNLTAQVRNIADVSTAIAGGDLSKKITVSVSGEMLQLKDTINTMVDQLNAFAGEVTRVAREVGTEGRLGGQAQVPGVGGTWKDLTDSVNAMAVNLTVQLRDVSKVATAIARGDLSQKITVNVSGEILQIKETMNTMVDQLNSFASEVTRVAREVGTDGKLGGQAQVPGVAGTWKDLTDSVNSMASNLTTQVRNVAEVATAVARGDLSRKITVDVRGEILQLKETLNTMVDQLNRFACEVTRVAREVGTDGKLGGQAQVPGVAGTWKDLTDTVNVMAANLTEQVRGIVKVVTAVATGDLKQKLTVNAKGEVAALAETINNMTDTLATFSAQVSSVAREVGVEGRLGGQANVPGAAGTWKDLTGNVNLLADNLTSQVRAIAKVATAVTKGDLTRSIEVDARGEVAELKDNINTMIDNLRLTTDRNTEQDWLKTNLARFTGMIQGQRELVTVGKMLLSELVPLVDAHQGLIYQMDSQDPSALKLLASYANGPENGYPVRMPLGAGFIGQCAVEKRRMLITDVPADTVPIDAVIMQRPRNLAVFPVVFEDQVKAVLMLASLGQFAPPHLTFLEQLTASIGIVLNSIEATMQTEALLKQSQQLAIELQTRQTELQLTNEQLGQKAQQLAEQNVEVERKNQEIEQARRALEEKASELALASKYKSEFLANISHELRTPLNSILILGQQLADNVEHNLRPKQVEFARTIHAAGSDLLNLITDILDLSKIESGTVTVDIEEVFFAQVIEVTARPFRHEAESRRLSFQVKIDPGLGESLVTDPKRLQQVLKNLLSNAFKFTKRGGVSLKIARARSGWSSGHPVLRQAPVVVGFEVADTGIGIPYQNQRLIFEAFQQADASTSRKYGGTGLGLAISRELANLLGGEIHLDSTPGQGSIFTLYLPLDYIDPMTPLLRRSSVATAAPLIARGAEEQIFDDSSDIAPGDAVMLIVDDDPHYARVLLGLARDKGFKGVIARNGQQALQFARQFRPGAITLDIFLPDMLGWTVLNNLKLDPAMRHIPVQIISLEEDLQYGLAHGAFGCLVKPATTSAIEECLDRLRNFIARHPKRLLVVESNEAESHSMVELLDSADIEIVVARTAESALVALLKGDFDCCVIDLRLTDMSGVELLDLIKSQLKLAQLPVIVYTDGALDQENEYRVKAMAQSIVLKDVHVQARLFAATALFLHRNLAALPASKQKLIEYLNGSNEALRGRKVLVVDDDARNIFALATILENHEMEIISATSGRQAISIIESTPDLSAVLMDIMMPEMEGYETIRLIRQNPKLRSLPILALTAKAMKGDREKCLQAGASEYVAKPVNAEQLLSMLRLWSLP